MAETGSQYTTGIVTTSPLAPSYDAGKYAIDEAQKIYEMGGPSYYEGQTYAGYSPEQIASMEAQYNRAVGGKPESKHLVGLAADIKTSDINFKEKLYHYFCFKYANTYGIGIYDWGVHIDVRADKARWDYRA